MISYLLAGPAEEPVSLVEAKAFLRLDAGAEDALVTTLIAAARLHVEGTIGRAMVRQGWRLVLDAWPAERVVRLPVAPLLELTAIRVFDEQDDEHVLGLGQFRAETRVAPARLLLPGTVAGMPVLSESDARGVAVSHSVVVRFRTDVKAGDRFGYRGRWLSVVSAADLNGRRAWLSCACVETGVVG